LKHHPQDKTPTSTKHLVEPLGDEDIADELHREDREESAKIQRKSRRQAKKALKLMDDEEAEKRKEKEMTDIKRRIDAIGTPVGYESWLKKEEAEEANNSKKKKRNKGHQDKKGTTNQTKSKHSSKRGNRSSNEANRKKKAKLQQEGSKKKPPTGISIAKVSTKGRPPICRYCGGKMNKPGELHMIRTSVSRANSSWKESAHFHFKCCRRVMTKEEEAQLLAIMHASDEATQEDMDKIVC